MTSPTGGGGRTSDDDLFLLFILGFFGLAAAAATAATWWAQAVSWLLERQVLVAGAQQPLLALPASGGAGLDVSRLALAAAALIVVVAGAVSAIRRRLREEGLQ